MTAEALEQSWEPHEGRGPLWHGTSLQALPEIARDGLRSLARTHVHLAAETDREVGKRARIDVFHSTRDFVRERLEEIDVDVRLVKAW